MSALDASVEAAIVDALARPSDAAYVALHLPAPRVEAARFARAAQAGTSFVFAAPDGPALAGAGVTRVVQPVTDPVAARAALAIRPVEWRGVARVEPAPLRAFVAMPFPDDREAHGRLARGIAILPRWTYVDDGTKASVVLVAPARACTGPGAALVAAEWRGILSRLDAPLSPLPRVVRSGGTTHAEYLALVEAALGAIARDEVRKVVASRLVAWRTEGPIDPLAVLARLVAESGIGAHAAVQHSGDAFVAVTPERVLRRRGVALETEALAGTADVGAGGPAALAGSRKDADEHAWVVHAIRDVLAPICASLDVPDAPGVKRLRQVLHLHTPIRGTLREPLHVLDLARRLHPTPAIGGFPSAPALQWIRAHEPEPRGLYAGLVGWFDTEGDGDLWAGLRGATLSGNEIEQRVGAGIVAASRPEEEWLETEAKRRALTQALGAAT